MITRVASIFFLIGLTGLSASAQDPWEYRTSAGEYAFASGDHERAEAEFEAALEIAQKLPPGDRRLETSLENLARLYEFQSRLDEAQPLYQLLLVARENRLGADSPQLLDTLVAVARVAVSSGDSPTAGASLLRYLEIAESSRAADPGQHWRALAILARMRTIEEHPEEALQLQRRAVKVLSDDPAADDVERATQLESLAQMELLHGSATEAEALLDQAVELRVHSGGFGIVHTLASAAATALGAGETELADRLAQRALDAAAEKGTTSLAALKVAAAAAWMRIRRGGSVADLLGAAPDDSDVAEAEQRLKALVEIQQAGSLTDQSELAESWSRLARTAALRGDADEAASWQGRYVDAISATAGTTNEKVLLARSDLVSLLAAAGRIDQAAAENTELISDLEQAYGPDDAKLSLPLQRQYDLLSELGRKKEAKAIKKRLRKFEKSRR
jgi:tetratricopeptide (TPR) repeat protein